MTETRPTISLNAESLATWNKQGLERLRYAYDLKQSDTVIDIGAYKGEWANEIWRRYRPNMIVVEPTEYIRGFEHGRILNYAASTHYGKVSFGGRSYYTSAFECHDHEYEAINIADTIKEYSPITLLKVNIEGGEYEILPHIIGTGLHKGIKNIQVQFHEIAGLPYEKWYEEIAEKLSKTHSLTWQYKYCWENWKLND